MTFLNEPELIHLHTDKWFQVLLSNMNNSICMQLNGFKYCYLLFSHSLNGFSYCNLIIMIIPSKRLQVSHSNNSFQHYLIICTQLNGFKQMIE